MSTQSHVLNADTRANAGKGVARKLRAAGKVPAVCYGYQLEAPLPLVIDPTELLEGLRSPYGTNTVFSLLVEGKEHNVVLKDHQEQVISNKLMHVDLLSIDLSKPVQVQIPMRFSGKAPGVVLDSGILEFQRREIEVECLPTNIPLSIDVPLDDVQVGDTLHISDIVMPENVVAVTPGRLSVLVCRAPVIIEDTTAEEEGAVPVAAGDAPAAEADTSDE